jgi:hypothetical protein
MTLEERNHLAQISDELMCWDEFPDGSRLRWWCKICRDEGKPWLTDTPCDHVITAEEGGRISREVARATIERFRAEAR